MTNTISETDAKLKRSLDKLESAGLLTQVQVGAVLAFITTRKLPVASAGYDHQALYEALATVGAAAVVHGFKT